MAKKGRIERNKRVLATIQKESAKRESLVSALKDPAKSYDQKFVVMMAIQKLKRDGSATRYRNRCAITGRSRAYYSKFGLSRNIIREYGSAGLISGLKKSSW